MLAKMSNNGQYSADKASSNGEPEFGQDPASGGFFASDYKSAQTMRKTAILAHRHQKLFGITRNRNVSASSLTEESNDSDKKWTPLNILKIHDDLKMMLDSNKDALKLEAMKRIIGMVAKGRDASDLFPAVVKNVVSKNIEVKKLVYVYLVRYAEEQQDLALLSISTFQRGLKDPNQLIRASALRVLSSIRVPVIVPIMMLGIKDSVADMSPYVRKTAAHAIPKLYSLDPEQKEELIEVIEKLLSDKTTLVVGSAVMAFEEVCPERIDLIHKNYRKMCNLLVDVEEWGQVIIINMLTRYGRTQFIDPNRDEVVEEESKAFYESDETSNDEASEKGKKKIYVMDPDHRLLLRNCKPLLQSRNASVVMAVVQLYYYLAPRTEVTIVTKAMIRLLHSHREVQSVVLSNIATMSTKRKGMFEPFLKSFFVRSSDSTHIKLLKLDTLTNLATETNISIILREFQTYVSSADKEFVAATIQAIGRCASSITEVTDTCLNGLVSLLSNRDEAVVAESVVVIKKLLQMQPTEHKEIIGHMAKLVDTITVPMARASILWLLGEYSDRVPKIAPDVLRKMAKTFIHEEDIVKLQTLNLATKLLISNPKQTKLLCNYVFNLAKYDQNYDIRDRTRFLRQLVQPTGEKCELLSKYAKKIFLSQKPAPVLESRFKDRDSFQLGSLSHYIFAKAYGYHELPNFPEVAPDPSVRNVEIVNDWAASTRGSSLNKKKQVKKSFYSSTESSSEDDDDSSEIDSDDSEENSDESSANESSEEDDEDKSESLSTDESDEVTDSSEPESTSESSDSESYSPPKKTEKNTNSVSSSKKDSKKNKPQSNLDLLLDFGDATPVTNSPLLQPASASSVLLPTTEEKAVSSGPSYTLISNPMFISNKTHELLNKVSGNGLGVAYRFPRSVNIFSTKMTSVEITLTNHSPQPITSIQINDKKLASGVEVHGIPTIDSLAPNASITLTIGIDYNESMQPGTFDIKTENGKHAVTIKAPIGEIIQPVSISEADFQHYQNKLRGMNENSTVIDVPSETVNGNTLTQNVYEVANVMQVPSTETSIFRFAGQTLSTHSIVLVTAKLEESKVNLTVNCDKMVIGSMLLKEMKQSLAKL